MEEQGDEGEGDGHHQRAHKDIGHTLADGGLCPVGQAAEDGQQDQGRQIVAGHDDAHDPLHVQNLVRVARFQLRGGDVVHPSGEDVRQKGGAPGVVHLPQKQDAEEGKADEESPLVIQLQTLV